MYEVKLGDEFLMSSLFTVAEQELATLGLAQLDRDELDVVVGGLGLGYTAGAALADPRVRSLHVVEALEAVIDWHERRLLPLSPALADDPRCHLGHADFFALVRGGSASAKARRRRSTRSCSTSTTRPGTCCTARTPPSTPRPACSGSRTA